MDEAAGLSLYVVAKAHKSTPRSTPQRGEASRFIHLRARESAESWRTVLRDLKTRGLRAPVLAVGDGALGFWAAVREVWPATAEQRCWVHRLVNVLDKLPKGLQPRAKRALHEIMTAETRAAAEREIARFAVDFDGTHPKLDHRPGAAARLLLPTLP